ncbi:MAG: hypothetical protein M1457_08525 [bacterium]|nr:hypothetical protein [bacterium]
MKKRDRKPWTPPRHPSGEVDYEHFTPRDWREYERHFRGVVGQLKAAGLPVFVVNVEHDDLTHELN